MFSSLAAFLFFVDFRLCSSSSLEISSVPADGVEVVSCSSLSFCGEFVHHKFLQWFIYFLSSVLLISIMSLFVCLIEVFQYFVGRAFSPKMSHSILLMNLSQDSLCVRETVVLTMFLFVLYVFKIFFTRVLQVFLVNCSFVFSGFFYLLIPDSQTFLSSIFFLCFCCFIGFLF